MSIFSETIIKAIGDYRKLLRRYLEQSDRVKKLKELKLKSINKYSDDLTLYKKAQEIIQDVQDNMRIPDQGYYSYSGLEQFSNYLKEYLGNYEIQGDNVVHRAQRASKALIQAIQLAMLPNERLDDGVAEKLQDCGKQVIEYGSEEQQRLYRENLERQAEANELFYSKILQNFEKLLFQGDKQAA